jgi:hypothetical protein
MSTAYDPIVARALDRLVAGIESDPDEALRRARVAAQGLKRRRAVRIRRTAIIALAALALLTGAALASARFDHGLDPVPRGQRVAVILWTYDVPAAFAELTAKGAPALVPPHEWLGRLLIAWSADPDGNPIQIVQPL